jgi:hypothetical protein
MTYTYSYLLGHFIGKALEAHLGKDAFLTSHDTDLTAWINANHFHFEYIVSQILIHWRPNSLN